jgi:hypothetical protein
MSDLAWAEKLVQERALVLHTDTGTVGRVLELYDGEGKLYTPPGGDRATQAPVLVLEPAPGREHGSSFIAKAGSFIVFTMREAQFLQDAQAMLSGTLAEMAGHGGRLGVLGQTGVLVMAAILRAQLRELERLHPGVAPSAA